MDDLYRQLVNALRQAPLTRHVPSVIEQRRADLLDICQLRPPEQWRLYEFTDEELIDIRPELEFEKQQALSHELLRRSDDRLRRVSIYSYIRPVR